MIDDIATFENEEKLAKLEQDNLSYE